MGQVSAVSLDVSENVVIFHRGNRKWDEDSFNKDEIFQQRHLGTIEENTIIVLNKNTGEVIYEWGANMLVFIYTYTYII